MGRHLTKGRFDTRWELEVFVVREYRLTGRNQTQIAKHAQVSATAVWKILNDWNGEPTPEGPFKPVIRRVVSQAFTLNGRPHYMWGAFRHRDTTQPFEWANTIHELMNKVRQRYG